MHIIQSLFLHPTRRYLWLGLTLAVCVLELDQWTKHIMLRHFYWTLNPEPIALTPWVKLVLAWRPGISLGLFEPYSPHGIWIYRALTVLLATACVWRLHKARDFRVAAGWGLALGASLGYFADRIQFKAFYHFIDIGVLPAFNLADMALVLGLAIISLSHALKTKARP